MCPSLKIRVGHLKNIDSTDKSEAQVLDVTEIYKHPAFDGTSYFFDIAILTTESLELTEVCFE